ncbi:MAG: hypothetical protein IKC83_04640 [Clostridia bacterium]|nr:hypothetical protein [Clostridia bacterium]
MANKLLAGFGRVNITPPIGIGLAGYFQVRISDGILDELESNALALSTGDKEVIMIAVDNIGFEIPIMDKIRADVSERVGLPEDAVFVHCTHTHTGPRPTLSQEATDDASRELAELLSDYTKVFIRKVVDSAVLAHNDLAPAKMGYGVSRAERVAFIRRYRMKDGSVRTNPGVNNPDIVEPIGVLDDSVNVIRFKRETDDLVFVNFANHPDTVGGNKISGDWPTLTRSVVEKAIDNTKCIFFNGAQGDVNHVNVHPVGGDFNGMFNDFDGCSRGYAHTLHIARVVAGAVLKVYDKVEYKDVDKIGYVQKLYDIPSNKPTQDEMPLARQIVEYHDAGRDEELPYKGMMLTTMLADARRKIRLENGPDLFTMRMSAVSIGNIGIVGVPGEPFNGIGVGIKEAEGWDLIVPCCIVNGRNGYFPMKNAYDEGGYEAATSNFSAGVAERMIDAGKELLSIIKE